MVVLFYSDVLCSTKIYCTHSIQVVVSPPYPSTRDLLTTAHDHNATLLCQWKSATLRILSIFLVVYCYPTLLPFKVSRECTTCQSPIGWVSRCQCPPHQSRSGHCSTAAFGQIPWLERYNTQWVQLLYLIFQTSNFSALTAWQLFCTPFHVGPVICGSSVLRRWNTSTQISISRSTRCRG